MKCFKPSCGNEVEGYAHLLDPFDNVVVVLCIHCCMSAAAAVKMLPPKDEWYNAFKTPDDQAEPESS